MPIAWTEEEDRLVIKSLAKLGNAHWKAIATGVPGRDGSQCRDRFHRVIKRSPRYRDILPDHVIDGRRRPVPAVVTEPAIDVSVDDADLLALELPIDFEGSAIDKFSFEEMCQLGAMPHLAQPVPFAIPSPSSLAALPQFQEQVAAAKTATPLGRAPGLTFTTVPKIPSVMSRKSGQCATAGRFGFSMGSLSTINKMINKPLAPPPKLAKLAKTVKTVKTVKKPAHASRIIFNPQLVRSIA